MKITRACLEKGKLKKYGYELLLTYISYKHNQIAFYRKYINKKIKIEIDYESREITAYKRVRGVRSNYYCDYWEEIEINNKWIEDIEKYIIDGKGEQK